MTEDEFRRINNILQDAMRRCRIIDNQSEKASKLEEAGACKHEVDYIKSREDDEYNG